MIVKNLGNDNDLDPLVSMSADWTCSVGTIAKENTDISTESAGTYVDITATPTAVEENIAKTTDGTASEGTFYTKLTIPVSGVGGSCSSNLIVGAS